MSGGNQVSLNNVITISIAAAQTGAGLFSTSNLALFTDEPFADSFGSLGYAIYLDPTQVGVDFGSASKTFKMANQIFSQQPNILAGGGYLVIIPFIEAIQQLAFSGGTPATGSFVLNYNGGATSALPAAVTASQMQTALQLVPGLEDVTVSGGPAPASFLVNMKGIYGPVALLTVTSNTLETSASAAVTVTATTTQVGEDLATAVTRTQSLVQYFAMLPTLIIDQTDMLAAAAVVQALPVIWGCVQRDPATVAPNGQLDLLEQGQFTQTRGLFYGAADDLTTLLYSASYFGRMFCVDFTGSKTTLIAHLKTLTGVLPDPSMNQTLLNQCVAAGADTYVSIRGVPKVFTSGANLFFDQVYNRGWFKAALQVAGFNYLAETDTKIPQTDEGMDGLMAAYGVVCAQGITNGYGAPGAWNSPTTFGNQADLIQNIAQVGYYLYAQPISQQSQTDRVARMAPLGQLAFKEAGGIQSSNLLVFINP